MAICLSCLQHSPKVGELCTCGASYTVLDNQTMDSFGLLGTLVAGKFVPTAILKETREAIYFDAWQPAVARALTLIFIKPVICNNPENRALVLSVIEKIATIKQQNTPTLLEVAEIPEKQAIVATFEAIKGVPLPEFLATHEPDPVSLIHIIHQLLQALATHHKKNITFPHISVDNIHIHRSGGDDYFLKLSNLIEKTLIYIEKDNSLQDDVFYVGELVLSILTGKKPPFEQVELPPEREFLMPIAQLFIRAIAPISQRFESCAELLQEFESALDLNANEEKPAVIQKAASSNDIKRPTPLPFDQVIWMHRPPMD